MNELEISGKKIAIISCTVLLSVPMLGLASVGAFRACTRLFSKQFVKTVDQIFKKVYGQKNLTEIEMDEEDEFVSDTSPNKEIKKLK